MQFPVLLKLSGDDELFYAANNLECAYLLQQAGPLLAEDVWLDSTGQSFSVQTLDPSSQVFTEQEIASLVQNHFFNLSQSCVTKIQASTIEGYFELVKEQQQKAF